MKTFNLEEIVSLSNKIKVVSMTFSSTHTTIEDFVDYLNKYKKYSLLSKYQWLVYFYSHESGEEYVNKVLVEYDSGTYTIASDYITASMCEDDLTTWVAIRNNNYYKEPTISSALFYNFIKDKIYDKVLKSDVVSIYREIIWGKRAPKGFWKEMTDEDFNLLLDYEANFLFDISSIDKARHFVTNDIYMSKIPPVVKTEKGIKLYDIVKRAQAIEPWEMRSLPQRMSFSRIDMYNAICDCLDSEGTNILLLTRTHVLKHAPCLLNKFKSMKAIREFYMSAKQYGLLDANKEYIDTEHSYDLDFIDRLKIFEARNSNTPFEGEDDDK